MPIRQITQLPPMGVSNRYIVSRKELVPTRELTLTIDSETGLLSLGNYFSANELRHSHKWLKYQEPEEHCLALGEDVLDLTAIAEGSLIAGLSWKDEGLIGSLARFNLETTILYPREQEKGNTLNSDTWVRDSIDVQESISVDNDFSSGGKFIFLSARHLLEHALSIDKFLRGLATKVRPDGYILLEVPDCEKAIKQCDYSIIWEEHIHYFTADSLKRTLRRLGWHLVEFRRETVESEAVLIAIVQPPLVSTRVIALEQSQDTYVESNTFGRNFNERRSSVRAFLRAAQQEGNRLYLLGANHTASNFIDLFGSEGLFEACLDDNPDKQGKYISRLNVPIVALDSLRVDGNEVFFGAIHPGRAEAAERKLVHCVGPHASIHRVCDLIRLNRSRRGPFQSE
jgi:hypothetical protein